MHTATETAGADKHHLEKIEEIPSLLDARRTFFHTLRVYLKI